MGSFGSEPRPGWCDLTATPFSCLIALRSPPCRTTISAVCSKHPMAPCGSAPVPDWRGCRTGECALTPHATACPEMASAASSWPTTASFGSIPIRGSRGSAATNFFQSKIPVAGPKSWLQAQVVAAASGSRRQRQTKRRTTRGYIVPNKPDSRRISSTFERPSVTDRRPLPARACSWSCAAIVYCSNSALEKICLATASRRWPQTVKALSGSGRTAGWYAWQRANCSQCL